MENSVRMLYLGTASGDLDDQEIRRIVDVSRANNAKIGVTGVLVMGGGGPFIQVPEGDENKLIRLYGK